MCGFDHDTPFQSIVVFGLNMIHTLVINLVSRALLDLVWKPTDPKAEKLLGAAVWGSEKRSATSTWNQYIQGKVSQMRDIISPTSRTLALPEMVDPSTNPHTE